MKQAPLRGLRCLPRLSTGTARSRLFIERLPIATWHQHAPNRRRAPRVTRSGRRRSRSLRLDDRTEGEPMSGGGATQSRGDYIRDVVLDQVEREGMRLTDEAVDYLSLIHI